MFVANIKIWKSHLNIREDSDYLSIRQCLYRVPKAEIDICPGKMM